MVDFLNALNHKLLTQLFALTAQHAIETCGRNDLGFSHRQAH
jgi:hypothetical protein